MLCAVCAQAVAIWVMTTRDIPQLEGPARFVLALGVGSTVFLVAAPWGMLIQSANLLRHVRQLTHQVRRFVDFDRDAIAREAFDRADPIVSELVGVTVRLVEETQTQRTKHRMMQHRIDARVEHETRLATTQLQRDVETDPLTGLGNRRALDRVLASLFDERSGAARLDVSLLAIDMDRFKSVNDTLGHDVGDRCLCFLADVLQSSSRPSDAAIRLGGDEFILVLPEQHLDGAEALAHRLATLFAQMPWTSDEVERPSLSIGVATVVSGRRMTGEMLLRRADEALYDSKRNGRGRVTRAA